MQKPKPEPKVIRSRFQKHISILIWKSYVQRQRRWRLLLLHSVIAFVLFAGAALVARPVFLTPLQAIPEPPLTFSQILDSIPPGTILGYTPNVAPYDAIMERAAALLGKEILAAETQRELDMMLFKLIRNKKRKSIKVIFVLWQDKVENVYKFQIRSTEVGLLSYSGSSQNSKALRSTNNPHLKAGFLSVQLAVSQAVLESASSPKKPNFKLSLVSMPVSPLMDKSNVSRVISMILMFFTLALLPPVLETESLVVQETQSRLKRALRLRNVAFNSMYIGWLSYAIMTALPVIFLGAVTMILIFRWIHIITAILTLLLYFCVMVIMSMIMAMYHTKARIACVWTTLLTLLQTMLAELLVFHMYTELHVTIQFLMHMFLPPLGLVHALNHFSLLQTNSEEDEEQHNKVFFATTKYMSVNVTLISWVVLILLYFLILMLMQRTARRDRAIGGQQSWKSIIFKKAVDKHAFRPIPTLTGDERQNLQPVDEFVSKAVSFRNVHKEIMGVPILSGVTFDIYRSEFTMLFAERIQHQMMSCMEDLLTGIALPDHGTIHMFGDEMKHTDLYPMNEPYKMGYCDQSDFLIEDFTVDEHLNMYMNLCLWHISQNYVSQYKEIRVRRLLKDCDLKEVSGVRVRNLDIYYRAQLCWALAILLEPKLILIPNFVDHPVYMSVITDKIIEYKKFTTIININYANIKLENADRVFVFDKRVVTFGGTPAYMFFKYGRDYRLRLNLKIGTPLHEEYISRLLDRADAAGASVRSHLGSMLILRVPTSPTNKVAELIQDLHYRAETYGIVSMNISLPDSEEIFRRTLGARLKTATPSEQMMEALKRTAEPRTWRPRTSFSNWMHMKYMAWKYVSFYLKYKVSLIVTIISAILVGVFIGNSMAALLKEMLQAYTSVQQLEGQLLTVETLTEPTVLVMRVEESERAVKLAQGYVLSEANATIAQTRKVTYTALVRSESLTEYLVTKAIDSPDFYVNMFAYGIDVSTDGGAFKIRVLYSPMHNDHATAARSLARVYTALLRYYTGKLDTSIQITDYPLLLDLRPWMKKAETPPLMTQVLLVLTISHITLVPSNEYGLIRHTQKHAANFSPARYWIYLFICDILTYWFLVGLMCTGVALLLILTVPSAYLNFLDLLSIPTILMVYGLGCVPQAYLFSLGPRPMLNSMAFVIVNIVFGEATLVTKLFYHGSMAASIMDAMAISPQFNVAYALVKIKSTFLYNTECIVFKLNEALCEKRILHKCCAQCGVLQECFEKKLYWLQIINELISCLGCFALFFSMLLLWEYRVVLRTWKYLVTRDKYVPIMNEPGTKERDDVLHKEQQIRITKKNKNAVVMQDTFGEYILAVDVSLKKNQLYRLHNIYLGLGKGEALAVSGLTRHGREALGELLCGYKSPSEGRLWTMSKYRLRTATHSYCRNVSICCQRSPLPGWMSVTGALELIAVLRGVPKKHVHEEVKDLVEALDLCTEAKTKVSKLHESSRKRLHFAVAVIAAPAVVVLDQCTAYQSYAVRRAMYQIIYQLRKNGHAILISDSNVERHMPVSNRLAILLDGHIVDIGYVDSILARHSEPGYTVVVQLKQDVDVTKMFAKYFTSFITNDMSNVLVNMQVLDDLTWAEVFTRMEKLKAANSTVNSYIVCSIPIDYIYNSILETEVGLTPTPDFKWCNRLKGLIKGKPKKVHTQEQIAKLKKFEKKYAITSLTDLPWSIIF